MVRTHKLISLNEVPETINGLRDLHNNDYVKFLELINNEKIEYIDTPSLRTSSIKLKCPVQTDIDTIQMHELSYNCIKKEITTHNKPEYGEYKIMDMDRFNDYREANTFYEFDGDLTVRLNDNSTLESVKSGLFISIGRKFYMFIGSDESRVEKYEHCTFNGVCVVSILYLIKCGDAIRFNKTKSARKNN